MEGLNAKSSFDDKLNEVLNGIFSSMGGFAMSYFFSTTGFLLFYGLSYKNYASKIKRRIKSLLFPYLIWQCVILIIDTIQGQYTFSFQDFFRRTFLLVRWPINGAMWYVYAVFLMATLSPLLLPLFSSKKLALVLILVLLTVIQFRDSLTNNTTLGAIIHYGYVGNIITYLPAYLVGSFYGYYKKQDDIPLTYIFYIILYTFILDGTANGSFFNTTTMKMLPIVGILILPISKKGVDLWIYRLSFIMYAIHQPLITDIKPYINHIFQKSLMPLALINIFEKATILGAVFLLSFLIYYIIGKISPRLLSLMTGGRA